MSRAGTTLHGVGARGGLRRRKVRHGCCRNQGLVDMASALLRRQLAHKIALPQRCLFSSTSSVLAQAAPQSQSSSTTNTTTATPPGSKKAFNRHIAEELQGVSASEILAESGTRKDAQMRHFTGEGIWSFFFGLRLAGGSHWTDDCTLLPKLILGALLWQSSSRVSTLTVIVLALNTRPRTVC